MTGYRITHKERTVYLSPERQETPVAEDAAMFVMQATAFLFLLYSGLDDWRWEVEQCVLPEQLEHRCVG